MRRVAVPVHAVIPPYTGSTAASMPPSVYPIRDFGYLGRSSISHLATGSLAHRIIGGNACKWHFSIPKRHPLEAQARQVLKRGQRRSQLQLILTRTFSLSQRLQLMCQPPTGRLALHVGALNVVGLPSQRTLAGDSINELFCACCVLLAPTVRTSTSANLATATD